MTTKQASQKALDPTALTPRRPSKKEQILSLFAGGIQEVTDIAAMTQARPSYVASVLQEAGLLTGYHDLYTSSAQPLNVYSKFFAGKLGFKDEETARQSVECIDHFYRQFAFAHDRTGQHHALAMALTMFDRARWNGKIREAELFRNWLVDRLNEPLGAFESEAPLAKVPPPRKG
jgi:hypothetical protein